MLQLRWSPRISETTPDSDSLLPRSPTATPSVPPTSASDERSRATGETTMPTNGPLTESALVAIGRERAWGEMGGAY